MTAGRNYDATISCDGTRLFVGESNQCRGDDKSPFTIGTGWVPTPYYISSVRIWDTKLDDPSITENANRFGPIPATDKNRGHLIDEWVLTPDRLLGDTAIANTIAGKAPMIFSHKPVFVRLANTLPDRVASCDHTMENTLVAPQIVYWLCGAAALDARLEGIPFLRNFAIEEQWRDE